ncbi:selenoprotein S-like [Amphiura filiformis]|uniref:selenoprotein S-like n=1 Tax=Amphiura filiformis TaxID=82378 RepID=UPI003B21FCD8
MDDDGVDIQVDEDGGRGFFEDRQLPPDQANPTPHKVVDSASLAFEFLGAYGWYIILGLIALFYLKSKYSSRIQGWQQQRQQGDDLNRYDDATVLSRQEAMEKARQKMQEDHDARAAEHSVRQKQKEEEKRQQEIEDWENHRAGKGYKSKLKNKIIEEPLSSPGAEGGVSRPRKKLIRDNYSPLMGAGGGSGFRPDRRGFGGGGGG